MCDPLVTGTSRGPRGRAMAEQLCWGQRSAALMMACCRGGGGAVAVATAAAGFSELLMAHRGGKTGGRDQEKETKQGEGDQQRKEVRKQGGVWEQ